MRLVDFDMKDAGGAIVRLLNERKFVWKISERGRDSSTRVLRVGVRREEREREGRRDGGTEGPQSGVVIAIPPSLHLCGPSVAFSFLRRVIPGSGARDVIGLFDSDVEFAERAVAFFVGRVESEDVLGAQSFGEISES